MRSAVLALTLLAASVGRCAYHGTPPAGDEDITASLVTLGADRSIYSRLGHTLIRMRTNTGRDVCFTYEGESVSDNVLRYLTGRLKMGMFCVPTPVFLEAYRKSGRTIRENELNLSPAARHWLWKAMDGRAHEGISLPYDYLTRGCAKVAFELIVNAADGELSLPEFPAKYDRTLREIAEDALRASPWEAVLISGLTGTKGDADLPRCEKLILPEDLVETLSRATCCGKPALGPTVVLCEGAAPGAARGVPDPLWVAFAFFILVCIVRPLPGIVVPILEAIPGVYLVYLVFLSSVPSTGWNWLLVPFNPLPLCFWKVLQRKACVCRWGLVLLAWCALMIVWPHRLTHPAYLLLGIAFSVHYLKLAHHGGER